MRGWLRARAIGKRIECDLRGFKLSRAWISTYWDRLDYVMLTSFFGEAEIPLRGNIEAHAQQIGDDDNSDSPAAIGVAQWRSCLATSLPALPRRFSTKSAHSNTCRRALPARPLSRLLRQSWPTDNLFHGIINYRTQGAFLRPRSLEWGTTIGEQRTFRPEPPRHRHNEHTTGS